MSPTPIVSQISTLEVSVSVTAGVTLTSFPAVPSGALNSAPQNAIFHIAATGGGLVLSSCADSLPQSQLLLCSVCPACPDVDAVSFWL